MIYLIGTIVFSSVIMLLVGLLLLVEAKVVLKGDRSVMINNDTDKILQVDSGTSLLKALSNNNIFIPSACGGGSCCPSFCPQSGASMPLGGFARGSRLA